MQIAVFLLYARAVLGLLLGSLVSIVWGPLLGLAILVAMAAGGFGIANEKRWGYRLAVGAAGVDMLTLVWLLFDGRYGLMISLMFSVALVALLLHPQSRDYERIWFS